MTNEERNAPTIPCPPPAARPSLKDELIAAIRDEGRYFNMATWTVNDFSPSTLATCQTASCMAGHIVSLRPELAKKFLAEHPAHRIGPSMIRYWTLAASIWQHEMGERCRLDFFGHGHPLYGDYGDEERIDYPLADITREETVDHILGINPEWPQTP